MIPMAVQKLQRLGFGAQHLRLPCSRTTQYSQPQSQKIKGVHEVIVPRVGELEQFVY